MGDDLGLTDVDKILSILRLEIPDVEVEQLKAKRPTDDDGLWYLKLPNSNKTVQLESSTGMCPFVIETDEQCSASALSARTVTEASRLLIEYLQGKREGKVYLNGVKRWPEVSEG